MEWAEIFLGHLCQKGARQKVIYPNFFSLGMAWAEGRKNNLLTKYIIDKKVNFLLKKST